MPTDHRALTESQATESATTKPIVPLYVELAAEIGVPEAVLLVQLGALVADGASDADFGAYRDGRWWTRQSVRALAEVTQCFSRAEVARTLASLVSQGLVEIRACDEQSDDRSRWITLNYDACAAISPLLAQTAPFTWAPW